jgi:DNA helicase II / ATP-dependent DNA helicase PcrA
LQLAIYRLAWAAIAGVPLGSVGAAFLYVRSGDLVRPELASADEIAALLSGAQVPAGQEQTPSPPPKTGPPPRPALDAASVASTLVPPPAPLPVEEDEVGQLSLGF